jgi:hypothetical protein
MRPRRILIALGLALVSLGLVAPPASAGNPGPVVVDDPADATGPGDVLGFRLYQAGDAVVLQLRTKKPLNLFAAPAWNTEPSVSQIKFSIDGGGGPELEQAVIISPSPSGPNTLVLTYVNLTPTPQGDCVVLSQPQATIIRVRVQFSCRSGFGALQARPGRRRFGQLQRPGAERRVQPHPGPRRLGQRPVRFRQAASSSPNRVEGGPSTNGHSSLATRRQLAVACSSPSTA